MRLKTVFLLCFAVACLPALGWSAWIAITARSEWAHAASAVRKAEAMGDALQLIEALSLERGVLQERRPLGRTGDRETRPRWRQRTTPCSIARSAACGGRSCRTRR